MQDTSERKSDGGTKPAQSGEIYIPHSEFLMCGTRDRLMFSQMLFCGMCYNQEYVIYAQEPAEIQRWLPSVGLIPTR